MSDRYEQVRSLSFPTLASVLGIDMTRFRRRKENWQGYCPVHNSQHNNNCFAYGDDGKFHCFSCGAKGRGGLDLVIQVKGIKFQAAVELLQPAAGQAEQIPTSAGISSPGADSCVLRPLEKDTWKKFPVPCEWLEKRIPDATVRERYGVFCYNNPTRKSAYSGRVMIPVKDIGGNLFGYLGRAVHNDSEPKYLFPKNLPKSQFLFGADQVKAGAFGPLPLKRLYLVESPFSVMKFASLNLPAVAAYGWSVSEAQISMLRTICRGLAFLPDRNKSEEAAPQCADIARSLWVRFPPLPDGIEDPEHLTKEQILAL